jgi:short subunit dehydrogenase-like uncharacterized protein
VLAVAAGEDAARALDPAALIPEPARAQAVRSVSPITLSPRRGVEGAVLAPMSPAPFINPAVVQRSAALAEEAGEPAPPFRYREGIAIPGGSTALPLRWGIAAGLSGTQMALGRLTRARAGVRRTIVSALGRITPGSGFGPAEDRLEGWRWGLLLLARTSSGRQVRVTVDAGGHPGYLATARMLAEAGLLMAEAGATPSRTGCLTPAAALGTERIERFAEAGVRFAVAP